LRRRNAVGLVLVVSLLLIYVIYYYFPKSYDLLNAYLISLAIVFKSAFLAFFTASKLKLIAFVKGLTFLQGSYLLIKRWFLDNVFSIWLQKNVIRHLRKALREAKEYYLHLDFRKKIKNIVIAVLVSAVSFWFVYISGYLSHLVLFAELKVIIISISKSLIIIFSKIFALLFNSWLTPILEVFAFSWLFEWLERKLGKDHPINRTIRSTGEIIVKSFALIATFINRFIDPLFNRKISYYSNRVGKTLKGYIENKKIEYEYEQFDKLERVLLNAQIDAYFSYKDIKKAKDKLEFYTMLNAQSKYGIYIVAFVARDKKGGLLPPSSPSYESIGNDILILEGVASSQTIGVKRELGKDPDYSDFWLLNNSLYHATIGSKSNLFEEMDIKPQSLQLIKVNRLPKYTDRDLYAKYKQKVEPFTAVKR